MKVLKEIKISDGVVELLRATEEAQKKSRFSTDKGYLQEVAEGYYIALKNYAWSVFKMENTDEDTVKLLRIADSLEPDLERKIVKVVRYRDHLDIFDKLSLNCNI